MAHYKVNEDPEAWKQASNLRNEFGLLSEQVREWILKAQKSLPRRNQRFERSCNALENKLFLVSQIYFGLTLSGELPKFHSAEDSKW